MEILVGYDKLFTLHFTDDQIVFTEDEDLHAQKTKSFISLSNKKIANRIPFQIYK